MTTQTPQICPACGCTIGADPVTKEGVLYCCLPCSEGSPCECDNCTKTKLPPPEG